MHSLYQPRIARRRPPRVSYEGKLSGQIMEERQRCQGRTFHPVGITWRKSVNNDFLRNVDEPEECSNCFACIKYIIRSWKNTSSAIVPLESPKTMKTFEGLRIDEPLRFIRRRSDSVGVRFPSISRPIGRNLVKVRSRLEHCSTQE